MRPDGSTKKLAPGGPEIRLSHCAPSTGEVLDDGKFVCPPGTAYEPFAGYARCLPSCPSGKWHDCYRLLAHADAGENDATPERYCFCVD